MANYPNVVKAKTIQLVGGQDDLVSFTDNASAFEITNLSETSTDIVWVRFDVGTVEPEGDDCIPVLPRQTLTRDIGRRSSSGVQVTSSGTPKVTVERLR